MDESHDAEALRRIVERHRRGRVRTLGALLAVAVLAGPAIGWALGHQASSVSHVAASGSPRDGTASEPAPRVEQPGGYTMSGSSPGVATAGAPPGGRTATHLFSRTTAAGVAIRAYTWDVPYISCRGPLPAQPANSGPAPTSTQLLAEFSTAAAVGQSLGGFEAEPPHALSGRNRGMFGSLEGSPVEWFTAKVSSGVASVRLTHGADRDEMAPQDGWIALALPVTGANFLTGTVEALDAKGAVVEALTLDKPPSPIPVPVQVKGTAGGGSAGTAGTATSGSATCRSGSATSGSATSGSGTAGSGTAGSGTASSGTANAPSGAATAPPSLPSGLPCGAGAGAPTSP